MSNPLIEFSSLLMNCGGKGGKPGPCPLSTLQETILKDFPGLKLDMSTRINAYGTKVWALNKIVVPESSRGKGVGSKVMGLLLSEADKQGATLVLDPSTDFGASSKKRLVDFYKGFGFSKNKDQSITGSMTRLPKSN